MRIMLSGSQPRLLCFSTPQAAGQRHGGRRLDGGRGSISADYVEGVGFRRWVWRARRWG